MYMSEPQRRDARKAARPYGLRLCGRHASLHALTMQPAGRCGVRLACRPHRRNATRMD